MNKDRPVASREWALQLEGHTAYIRQCANNLTRDWDRAKDLAQDVLLHALERESMYQKDSNLKGWLNMVTRNLFINQYRKDQKQVFVGEATDNLCYGVTDFVATSRNEGQFAHDQELYDAHIDIALASKAPHVAATLKLRMEGYNYEEIGEQVGIPTGTVRSVLHRLRHKFLHFLPTNESTKIERTMQPMPAVNPAFIDQPAPRITVKTDPRIDECRAIIAYLNEYLPLDSFKPIDRFAVAKQLKVRDYILAVALPQLEQKGYVVVKKEGQKKFYQMTGALLAMTGEELSAMIEAYGRDQNEKVKAKGKPGQSALNLTFHKNPAHAITSSPLIDEPISEAQKQTEIAQILQETNQQTDEPSGFYIERAIDQPVRKAPPTIAEVLTAKPSPASEYGFVQDGQLVWFTDKQKAADEATAWAIAERQTKPVDLLQRIGEVKVQPTVTFF